MSASFSISTNPPAPQIAELDDGEIDAERIMAAPLFISLPHLVRRLLAAEARIAELERRPNPPA